MSELRMCPHCGGQMFMVKIVRAGLAEFSTDTNEPYKILKECTDKFDIEIVGCARCKEKVAESDLVTGVKCKDCGRIVGPMDINEDGICNVCNAVKQRAELANASREDLIKMLLEAERKANPTVAKMEKQIEKADEVIPESTVDATITEETHEETVEQNEKKTRKATRKKKDDTNNIVEPAQEETESSTETNFETETVNDIANQQEAPFPDVAMNLPVEAPVETTVYAPVEQEQAIGADFKMFDEGEEPF